MCSRFEISASPREVMAALNLPAPPPMPNAGDVRPTDAALIIAGGGDAALQPWGLSVDWSRQPVINARSETLAEKPTFRPLLDRRCAVPASAYFEWRTTERGDKRKNRIFDPNGPVLTMAGLTDGSRFTIVTCAAAPSVAGIHDRMPVILPPAAREAWLSPAPFGEVQRVLRPFAGPLHCDEETPPPPAQADLFG